MDIPDVSEEKPVNHLVVDASAIIKYAALQNIGANVYTVSAALAEIKTKDHKERLEVLPYELKIQEPSAESLRIVKEASKKTGDFPALSLTDLHLIALLHDLHCRFDPKQPVKYDIKGVQELVDASKERNDTIPYGFVKAKEAATTSEDEDCTTVADEDDEFDDEGWVDESNINNVLEEEEGEFEAKREMTQVAMVTTDFAIQNVVLHMRMHLFSINGLLIKSLKSYIMWCRSCQKTTTNMEKKFCPKCGNDTLLRIAVTVGADGHIILHINWQKLLSRRTTNAPVRTIKGGKHDNCHQFFEDQRMPHNHAAKVTQNALDDSPFSKHDVVSRSAQLGIRADRRNPQQRRRR